MKRAVKLTAVAVAVSLTMSLSLMPAKAQFNWTQVPGMIDVSGRMVASEKTILEELASGRLSQANADALKLKLDGIKELDTQFRGDGKLSLVERMKLILELDNLDREIQTNLTERKAAITDVPGRQSELAKKISDALVTGQLTSQQASTFNSKLQSIRDQEKNLRADGSLSSTDTLTLSLALDQLNSQIETSLKVRVIEDPGIAQKEDEIEKLISSLVSSGKLTSAQSTNFVQELERIKTKEKAFNASGNELDSQEILTLALELEQLKGRLNQYSPVVVTTEVRGINAKQAEVKKLISDALSTGKLNTLQAGELNHEYDRIEALEATFRGDGHLNRREVFTLTRSLDTLKTNLEKTLAEAQTHAPTVEEKKTTLTKRITDAKGASRIKPPELADELLAELKRIESKETFYKIDGSLNDTESMIISQDLDQLNSRFEATLQKLPSIVERKTAIETKMNAAIASGRLDSKAAQDLGAELTRIGFLENTFRGNDAVITENELVALNREYDGIEKKLDAVLPKMPDIASIREDLNKKIESGAASGKISASDAVAYKKELSRIADIEKAFKSDNQLAEWETLALNRDLDKLSKKLEGEGSDDDSDAVHATEIKVDLSKAAPDTRGHWAEKYIAILQDRGTIGGFPDGSFKPDMGITRAQFAAIATKALDLPEAGRPAKFTDLSKKHWSYKAVSAVSEAGLVGGYPDGSFRPEDKITRTQAFVILSKALKNADAATDVLTKYKDGKNIPTWAIPSVAKAANAGILVNYPDAFQIRPDAQATRAEVAALTYQTMANLGKDLPELTIGLEAFDKSSN